MRQPTHLPPRIFALMLCLAGACLGAQRPKHAAIEKTALNLSALPIGKQAMAAVVLDVKEGFHAQSHKPLDPNLIPFTAKLSQTPGLKFGAVQYPPGKIENYPALGKLSVYTGKVVLYFPVAAKADAKPGPIEIKGKLNFQICDDNACYPPESPTFTIKTEIVPAGTAVKANEPELFKSVQETIGGSTGSAPFEFLTAFLVGIIFNAVPCVLPVLPLKAIGFYNASHNSRIKSVSFGLAFSLGLIATFAVFGILIFGYSWVGYHQRQFDWGQLFTKWWFTLLIVVILLGMAVGTFGAFSVGVPRGLYSISPRHDTYWGNFLFGILTALLSTPCTFGMFVGLLAWAITQSPAVGVLILVTVGAGMAFPYLLLSALPEVARRFPRTGPWAELVKQMMGFLLLLTAVYFARPFIGRVIHGEAFWWLPFAVIVIAALYLAIRTFEFSHRAGPRLAGLALAALLIGGSLPAVLRLTANPFQWQPFTPAALDRARQSKVVLVEFTADWCGNCQYVEARVLHSREVVDAVRRHDVVMLKADVTRDDAPARPLLEQLNPAGSIPLTVIYSPNLQAPIELTGIYSKQDLQNALDRASRGPSPTVAALP